MKMLLSITLLVLPCIVVALPYDKQTLLDVRSYSIKFDEPRAAEILTELNNHLEANTRISEAPKKFSRQNSADLERIIRVLRFAAGPGRKIGNAADLLLEMNDETTNCGPQSYYAFMKAYSLATCEIKPDGIITANNLVNKLIIASLDEHGRNCRKLYLVAFKSVSFPKNEESLIEKVNRVLSSDVIDLLFPERDMKTRVRAIDIMPTRFVAHSSNILILDKLIEEAKGKKESTVVAEQLTNNHYHDRNDQLAEIVSEHLLEPCRVYVENYAQVFLSARLDLALDDDRISEINEEKDEKFDDAWIKFRVCLAILYDSEETLSLISRGLATM